MEKDRLIERLSFVMTKRDVLALAKIFTEMEDGIPALFELCQSDSEMISFHAAWVLENALTSNPILFSQNIPQIANLLPSIKSASLQRHFSKLMNHALEDCIKGKLPEGTCHLLQSMDMEPIVEACFEWLMSSEVKPAVKAHCMDILFYLSKRYGWIAEELPHVIALQMIDGTPGIKAKGVKVIGELRKRR